MQRTGAVRLSEMVADDYDPNRVALSVHASRLRKRIAPLGLTITCIKKVGYVMHRDDNIDRT